MVNIPIEVKQAGQSDERDIKGALNLNQVFSQPGAPKKPKNRTKIWLSAVVLLAIISLGLAAKIWLDRQKPFSQYQSLVGPEVETAVFLRVDQIESIIGLAMVQAKKDPGFFPWLKERVSRFLDQELAASQQDLISLFQDETFFFTRHSGKSDFAWIAGGKIKAGKNSQAQESLEKIARALRKNFGTNELSYRQIKINFAYSFNQINKPYYWSQIDGYVLITNELQAMQATIDRVMGK